MKVLNKKKLLLLPITLLILLVIIFIIKNKITTKDYEITYKVNGYNLIEKYRSDLKTYYFNIIDESLNYEINVKSDYIGKKVIDKVESEKIKNDICFMVKSKKIKTYPVCTSNKIPTDYHLLNKFKNIFDYDEPKIEYVDKKYENYFINTFLNKDIAVWNHHGFLVLDRKRSKDYNIFKTEYYKENLSNFDGNYIVVPNYDQKHYFNEIYIIDLKKQKTSKIKIDYDISYNSYYLGIVKKEIFLVDRKNKKEYKLNLKKKSVSLVSDRNGYGLIWDNGWKKISMTKLINNNYEFKKIKNYKYELIDNKLFLSYYNGKNKILVSNKNVDKIVFKDEEEVYYLVKDILYFYSPYIGEIKMIKNSNWQFYNGNPIYIY